MTAEELLKKYRLEIGLLIFFILIAIAPYLAAILVIVFCLTDSRFLYSVVGGLVGALVGFLLRPTIPLYGQLPLEAVITRGEHLRGLEQLFTSYAQVSFNYMLVGAIIGAFIGWITYQLLKKK